MTKPATGHLWLRDFRDDYTLDADITALASKVQFLPDTQLDAVFPNHIAGRLLFHSNEGVMWQGEVPEVYGCPARPLSSEHVREKFLANCARVGDAAAHELLKTVDAVGLAPDASWIRRTSALAQGAPTS